MLAGFGHTFSLYVARRLLNTILLVVGATLLLVFLLDFVELIRRAGDGPGASLAALALLAAQRTPSVTETVLPFGVLFAAMASFLQLSRKLELVVARASGISVWQLLTPALLVACLVGIIATAAFNPIAATLRDRATRAEAELLGGRDQAASTANRYIRQRSVDGQSIIRATASYDRGQRLVGVTAFVFSASGSFEERVDAESASFRPGYWQLAKARVLRPGAEPESHETYLVATNLTADQIAETLAPAQAISFWELPEVIVLSQQAGLPTARFELQYQSLLARPALLVTMVLIAATVSLRLFRLGGLARVILSGVVAGFMLYVVTKLAADLGAADLVPPPVAAWTPALIAGLLSVTVLLFQEDG